MGGNKQFTQFRPARGMTSSTFVLPANTPVAPNGLPLTDPAFGIFTGAEPPGSDYLVEQVTIYYDVAGADLRIGGATSCVFPIVTGTYFPVVIDAISHVYLANAGAVDITGQIFLLVSEEIA